MPVRIAVCFGDEFLKRGQWRIARGVGLEEVRKNLLEVLGLLFEVVGHESLQSEATDISQCEISPLLSRHVVGVNH